ncbi:unnamed protein product [Anisakis simplex]|uniref:Uncharacterized protein n=1 Tax=Anisakis simplex TaxID=6269 RepID=A0A0M3KKH0_ANISI|nr:unnamed protein product [Anisakis simplex]
MKQLVERRTLYQKHRQEANACKRLSEMQSLSMNQWITEEVQRIDHASNLMTFLASNDNNDMVDLFMVILSNFAEIFSHPNESIKKALKLVFLNMVT